MDPCLATARIEGSPTVPSDHSGDLNPTDESGSWIRTYCADDTDVKDP